MKPAYIQLSHQLNTERRQGRREGGRTDRKREMDYECVMASKSNITTEIRGETALKC